MRLRDSLFTACDDMQGFRTGEVIVQLWVHVQDAKSGPFQKSLGKARANLTPNHLQQKSKSVKKSAIKQ